MPGLSRGHFDVLSGGVAPMDLAGVKVVGDLIDDHRQDLPSEFAVLNLFDPRTGVPRAILDATALMEMRTGAVTAVRAKHLAPPNPRVLGHVGARGRGRSARCGPMSRPGSCPTRRSTRNSARSSPG